MDYVVWKVTIGDELITKNLEGSGPSRIQLPPRYLHGGDPGSVHKLNVLRCPSRDWYRILSKAV
jgi:hypothetical protein